MLYLLPINGQVTLASDFQNEGIIIFQSAKLDLTATAAAGDPNLDNTSINLLNSAGDITLHIAFRSIQNVILFNSTIGGGYGAEETVPLAGAFVGPDHTVTVYDHGDRFQILIDYHTVKYYNKRSTTNATAVSYGTNVNQVASPFSSTLTVETYSSFANIVPRGA